MERRKGWRERKGVRKGGERGGGNDREGRMGSMERVGRNGWREREGGRDVEMGKGCMDRKKMRKGRNKVRKAGNFNWIYIRNES